MFCLAILYASDRPHYREQTTGAGRRRSSYLPSEADQLAIPHTTKAISSWSSFSLWRLWFGPSSHMPLLSFERSNKDRRTWCLLLRARIVTEQHHVLLRLCCQSQKNPSPNPVKILLCSIHSLVCYLQHCPKKGLSNFGGLDLNKAPLDLHTRNPWNRPPDAFQRSYSGQCGQLQRRISLC